MIYINVNRICLSFLTADQAETGYLEVSPWHLEKKNDVMFHRPDDLLQN